MEHETPEAVAHQLARYAPTRIEALLDPAVGGGALVRPLLQRLTDQGSRVVVVDCDHESLHRTAGSFRGVLGGKLRCHEDDFLEWAESRVNRTRFDCIVMNPPFAAGKADLRPITRVPGMPEHAGRYVPLEAAFVVQSVQLLQPGGRLLAVLPCSVVMSDSLLWIRQFLLRSGSVLYVHELPTRTFPNVESRVYLLVFEKGRIGARTVLCNHDLKTPERLRLKRAELLEGGRFDFGFHLSRRRLSRIMSATDVQWRPLGEMVHVLRGEDGSPKGARRSVHTTDFHDGFWWSAPRHRVLRRAKQERRIRRGDILVKRVGRGCSDSFGLCVGLTGVQCSDCVLIIRPRSNSTTLKLLFALRSMVELASLRTILEKGTGAPYISEIALRTLPVPVAAADAFPDEFRRFQPAYRTHSAIRMWEAAQAVAVELDTRAGQLLHR